MKNWLVKKKKGTSVEVTLFGWSLLLWMLLPFRFAGVLASYRAGRIPGIEVLSCLGQIEIRHARTALSSGKATIDGSLSSFSLVMVAILFGHDGLRSKVIGCRSAIL